MIPGIVLARGSWHEGYGIATVQSKRSEFVTYYIWSDIDDYKRDCEPERVVNESPPDDRRKAANQSRWDLGDRMAELILTLQEDV